MFQRKIHFFFGKGYADTNNVIRKLGGQAVKQVVDDFLQRVLADDTVNHFSLTQYGETSAVTRLLSYPMLLAVQVNTQVVQWKKSTRRFKSTAGTL